MAVPPERARGVPGWIAWIAALAALTGAMVGVRPHVDKAHVALAYLLLILSASTRGSRERGVALAVLSFLCFNVFFLPPYGTVRVHEPLDWLVLFSYLAVATTATQLLYRARREAEEARRRAAEIDRLSTLGAETLNAGRADEALHAIAEVIRGTLGMDVCEIWLRDEGGGVRPGARAGEAAASELDAGLAAALSDGAAVVERLDGTVRTLADGGDPVPAVVDARALALPLRVRGRGVGVLRVARAGGITLDAAQRRFFAALSYYAALGAERVRLIADAERAESLRDADRVKDALLASVSHDLRTPLTTIKALAHELRATGDERAVIIEEEADRLNRFVADLLDLSRLNAGELRVSADVVAAEDLVGAALQRAAGPLAGREVRARVDTGDPILLGRFDFVHALRVLVNLLENAHKYAPPGTPLDLAVRREGDRLLIEVADRGPGIPDSEAGHVFAPFYRARGSVPDAGGAGLGLSIARRLAEAQGGGLAYQPRPGGGSVFTFSLPAMDLSEVPLE